MIEWWSNLTGAAQAFYISAVFFSLIFLWQFIASLIGLAGGEADVEVEVDADVDVEGLDLDDIEAHSLEEAAETVSAFRLLSLRAVLAFCTLFSWAGALYLNTSVPLGTALLYALGWGLAGWAVVLVLINLMRRLTETGTAKLSTCVGVPGSVYLDIPAGGQGEVRVPVSGVMSLVKARATGDGQIKAGTAVRVVRMLDRTTVEVQPVGQEQGKEQDG